MLVPQRQQSAIISHSRTDIGAEQSGQAHISASPSSQKVLKAVGAADTAGAASAIAGRGLVEAKSRYKSFVEIGPLGLALAGNSNRAAGSRVPRWRLPDSCCG